MPANPKAPQGPDPAVHEAIGRLGRTELSPLEETMFQAWSQANQVEDPDGPDAGMDFRDMYRQTGGRVLPPGELKKAAEKSSAIKAIMDAQKAHEQTSPIKAMMDQGVDQSVLQQDPVGQLTSQYGQAMDSMGGGGDMGGGMPGGEPQY